MAPLKNPRKVIQGGRATGANPPPAPGTPGTATERPLSTPTTPENPIRRVYPRTPGNVVHSARVRRGISTATIYWSTPRRSRGGNAATTGATARRGRRRAVREIPGEFVVTWRASMDNSPRTLGQTAHRLASPRNATASTLASPRTTDNAIPRTPGNGIGNPWALRTGLGDAVAANSLLSPGTFTASLLSSPTTSVNPIPRTPGDSLRTGQGQVGDAVGTNPLPDHNATEPLPQQQQQELNVGNQE